ncbi:MAG: hypothetical protein D6798_15405 [Deltaproteobacteria bacterium]|nr:MAG: hypothetical protein D6798_15405 [Deltaproteobacteria bacterium]
MADTSPTPSSPTSDGRPEPRRFGTFVGVYRPIFLTVLGALLYLREGWLVGDVGLLGALAVIAVAVSITGTTSLSLATIASNLRVRPGGAFAIISQALGLEAGGAIGIPLYVAQSLSSAMYIYAFTEAWAYLFPGHPSTLVAFVAFGAVALLAWRSAGLAFSAQRYMMFIVGAALLSALLGLFAAPELHPPAWLPTEEGSGDLVTAFSIFFPAVTGIMVGVGMSGDLKDPRRSIPRGTLAAWGTTSAIYTLFAFWYAVIATPDELVHDRTIMLDRALVGPVVLGGLLASTLMASLSSLVAAPRLLAAMAEHRVVPGGAFLARRTAEGEPRNAVLTTTLLAGSGLAAGSLDAIAPVITSFFIMTYLAINLVVYVEQVLSMISFRPAFRVPRWVSLVGIGLCLIGLSIGSPFGGVFEILLVIAIYVVLSRRHLETPWETVRSGIDVTLAAWAARRVADDRRAERAWQPDLLVPVADEDQVHDLFPLVTAITRRTGSVKLLGLGPRPELDQELPRAARRLRQAGLTATSTRLHTDRYMDGIGLALDALQGELFPPNLVLVDCSRVDDDAIAAYQHHCRRLRIGLALWMRAPADRPGIAQGAGSQGVSVWLSDRSPEWALELHSQNLDLPVLIGLLLSEHWDSTLRLQMVVRDPADTDRARAFLRDLIDQARLPSTTLVAVASGSFDDCLPTAPAAGVHLFGMPARARLQRLGEIRDLLGADCLFLMDSGRESALA